MKGPFHHFFMAADNPLGSGPHLERVQLERLKKEEISCLTQQQQSALRMAVYVGMNEKEAAEYDRRHSHLNTLIQESRVLLGKSESPA